MTQFTQFQNIINISVVKSNLCMVSVCGGLFVYTKCKLMES